MRFVSVALASLMAMSVAASPAKLVARNTPQNTIFNLRQADVDVDSVTNFNDQYAASSTGSGSNNAGFQAWVALRKVGDDLATVNSTFFSPPNLDAAGCNQVLSYLEGPFEPDLKTMANGMVAKKALYTADGLKGVVATEFTRSRSYLSDGLNYLCTRQCISPVSRCLGIRKAILDDIQAGINGFTS